MKLKPDVRGVGPAAADRLIAEHRGTSKGIAAAVLLYAPKIDLSCDPAAPQRKTEAS